MVVTGAQKDVLMPELPEVETIRRQLAPAIPGWQVKYVRTLEPAMMPQGQGRRLRGAVCGRSFLPPQRRGKFLLLPLSGDVWLTVHLGMTGRLLIVPGRYAAHVHDRFVFRLGRGDERAWFVFRDARKFGRLEASVGGPSRRVEMLGPDAWADSWDTGYLWHRLRGRSAPIKALLLDQRLLAGVGNIYADEALFEAQIHPLRPAGSLNADELEQLAAAVRTVLDRGVQALGCSLSDFFHLDGSLGSMQQALKAYGRQGRPCVRCGTPLVRTIVAGRGTAYCPTCQGDGGL